MTDTHFPDATFIIQDIGMGALYLASKLEECPPRIRDLINVYDLRDGNNL